MESGSREKLIGILKTFRNAMLVTQHDGKTLRSRPMALLKVEEPNGDVWFLTGFESGKVDDIHTSSEVCVALQDEKKFLSLSGHATITRDRNKIDELWTEEAKVWFPKGKDDPDLALIHVTPTEGEYWDNAGANRIKYLLQSVKAYVTGTTPNIDQSQHAAVSLNGGRA